MIRFSKLAAVLSVVPVLAVSGSAFAGSVGQLAGGPGNTLYQVKNLTQKGAYGSAISGTSCNDEIQYSMELSNTEFGSLTNVVLKTTLPSNGGTSTATATTDLGGTTGTTSSVNVTLGSNQTQSYENGTTVLYNGSGQVIKTLPDTVTTSGVNIGTLNGSTTEYVNFKVKVTCAPTTVTYSATATASDTATASATAQANCPAGSNETSVSASASATATASATASATSTVSQADAQSKADAQAKADANAKAQAQAQADANAKAQAQANSDTNSKCTVTVTPAPKATSLPNTGAGDVLGIFGASSAFGAAAHFVNSRRNKR
jgi:hypothetical protein